MPRRRPDKALIAAGAERRPVPAALAQHVFPAGQSGNPGGRTAEFAECQRICRVATPDAARRLIELMSSFDERVALMAADKLIERAWGKPREYDPKAEEPPAPDIDLSQLSNAELSALEQVVLLLAAAKTKRTGDTPRGLGTMGTES
jgi:hypothetical protein